jgi:hypothetical protein
VYTLGKVDKIVELDHKLSFTEKWNGQITWVSKEAVAWK